MFERRRANVKTDLRTLNPSSCQAHTINGHALACCDTFSQGLQVDQQRPPRGQGPDPDYYTDMFYQTCKHCKHTLPDD